ncbi:MAG TPA: HAD-IIB family hydrolase [Oculatellaceae cyanobacterium]|jgi:HAD superfamily hydrolase (TIGR01484 family)
MFFSPTLGYNASGFKFHPVLFGQTHRPAPMPETHHRDSVSLDNDLKARRTTVIRQIVEELGSAKKPLFMAFDFDGTLSPFKKNPQDSFLSEENYQRFSKLIDLHQQRFGGPLAIVTGRPVEDILNFFGTDANGRSRLLGRPVLINGLHGGVVFNCETNAYELEASETQKQAISRLNESLARRDFVNRYREASGEPLYIENKQFTLAIHTKSLPKSKAQEAEAEFRQLVDELGLCNPTLPAQERFILKPGEGLLEVVPANFNKNRGLDWLLSNQAQNRHLFFIGDGETDNDGFARINRLGKDATSVFIGKPREGILAKYVVPNPKHTGDISTETEVGDRERTQVSQLNVDAAHQIIQGVLERYQG